jgi:hypothetical protein
MRSISFSWDDGFRRSCLCTADIFEQFGLRTEFNILTEPSGSQPGNRFGVPFGDWELWNHLKQRGHIIHPHGTNHVNKTQIPLAEAQERILRCLETFDQELIGFDRKQAVFSFPYNASTPELEAWLPSVLRAFRTSGGEINPLPGPNTARITTEGSEDCEPWLIKTIEHFLTLDEGWLVLCVHGLDGEGWGPVRSEFLIGLLERLTKTPGLMVLPAIEVLTLYQA